MTTYPLIISLLIGKHYGFILGHFYFGGLGHYHFGGTIREYETQFLKNPNPGAAYVLVGLYYHNIKAVNDNDKALYYAKECIRLGGEKNKYARVGVNFVIACIYNEKKEKNLARYYLKRAIDLDKDDLIRKDNSIEKYGLQDIWDKEWEKKKK